MLLCVCEYVSMWCMDICLEQAISRWQSGGTASSCIHWVSCSQPSLCICIGNCICIRIFVDKVVEHPPPVYIGFLSFSHLHLFLWQQKLCFVGDLQPFDRHGPQVPRPKLDLPDWGEALVQQLLWLGSRWKRGLTKSKFPSATWRSSKLVFWWGHFQGSIPNHLLPAGVQGRPAVLLHGPREAGSIVGIPRASRVQTVWLLRQQTPHYVGVLLHGCAGE